MRIQRTIIEQLTCQLNTKNEELETEESRLKHLNERYNILKSTGTPFVIHNPNLAEIDAFVRPNIIRHSEAGNLLFS